MAEPTFQLLTVPSGSVPTRTLWSALNEADQDALVNGMWLMERQAEVDGPSRVNLVTTVIAPAPPETLGIPRCRYHDSTQEASERAATVIDGFGWRARTKLYTASTVISTGDELTVVAGTSVSGNYGKLKRSSMGDLVVAIALVDDGTWLEFIAVSPYSRSDSQGTESGGFWKSLAFGGM